MTLFNGSKPTARGCVKNLKKRIVKRLKRKPSQHYLDIDHVELPERRGPRSAQSR